MVQAGSPSKRLFQTSGYCRLIDNIVKPPAQLNTTSTATVGWCINITLHIHHPTTTQTGTLIPIKRDNKAVQTNLILDNQYPRLSQKLSMASFLDNYFRQLSQTTIVVNYPKQLSVLTPKQLNLLIITVCPNNTKWNSNLFSPLNLKRFQNWSIFKCYIRTHCVEGILQKVTCNHF